MAKKPAKKTTTKPAAKPAEAPKPSLITVQVNAKYLRGLRHICARQDIRYYLNGVYLSATKDGGRFYVGTDGHRVAVIREAWSNGETPQDFSLIIPRAVCEKVTPLLKQSAIALLKQVDQWTWTVQGGGDIQQTFKAIDGKYPEWQRVIPDTISGAVGTFNWSYLHEFNLCVKEAFGHSFSVELQHNGDGAGVVTAGIRDFLGLVMPMRHGHAPVMPHWAIAMQKENVKRNAAERLEAEKRAKAESLEPATADA